MRRRAFVAAALAAAAAPVAAAQDAQQPPLITPQNALEHAFIDALNNESLRPAFRRQLLESPVALALLSNAVDAPPFEVPLRGEAAAGLIFTSPARMDSVMGAGTPRAILTGREALERLRGKYVALNFRLTPMLTLEPDDIESYLSTPESSAGPAQ